MHGQWGRMGNVSIMSLRCNETPDDVIIAMMMLKMVINGMKEFLVLFKFVTREACKGQGCRKHIFDVGVFLDSPFSEENGRKTDLKVN